MNRNDRPRPKQVIGHRGASAYAPENTLESFELALRQGADSVEHDLQMTKDACLVCLHDRTLERTTNVRELFPDRGRSVMERGRPARRWFVHDFTLDEIRQLDAGSWFAAEYAGARVPTFHEVLDWIGDRATLLTELKDLDRYEALGVDVLSLFAEALRRRGIARGGAGQPLVTAQSFHEPTMRRAAEMLDRLVPIVLLIEPPLFSAAPRGPDRDRMTALADFATGIGPDKAILESCPEVVRWAHHVGLRVTPWTFRAGESGRFDSVEAEMTYYLSVLDVDGVITDNPDLVRRELSPGQAVSPAT